MTDVPINAEFENDVRRIVGLIETGENISKVQLTEWMKSPCPEIQAISFLCITEKESQCERLIPDERVEFIVSFLYKSIEENCGNDFRFDRFDALLSCRTLVNKECFPNVKPLARRIAKMLAKICIQSNDTVRRQVIDVVLEHVLQHPTIREYYSFWRDTPELRNIYDEGIALADKWLLMKEERSPQGKK